ncbi:MAG: hypothetical protein K6T16_02405, partial [Candidatus Pacearchaeota archaeon]|nr:hypothetical protein [Candidatus Pacearchaeota archaeon]
ITLLQGRATKKAIESAASLTAAYSDTRNLQAVVNYGKGKLNKSLKSNPLDKKEIEKLRLK